MTKYIVKDLVSTLQFLPYGLVTGMVVFIILGAINRRRAKKKKEALPVAAGVSYFMYMAILLGITFLSRESGSRRGVDLELFSTWGINDRNNAFVIENILLFIPYGCVSPWLFASVRNLFSCTLFGLVSSFLVEYLQMITSRGYFQIDDIITNTMGTLIGYLIFKCVCMLIKRYKKR